MKAPLWVSQLAKTARPDASTGSLVVASRTFYSGRVSEFSKANCRQNAGWGAEHYRFRSRRPHGVSPFTTY